MAKGRLEIIQGLGYRITDIEDELGKERYLLFTKWFAGSTGAIADDGSLLIYPWDYESFLEGRRNLD